MSETSRRSTVRGAALALLILLAAGLEPGCEGGPSPDRPRIRWVLELDTSELTDPDLDALADRTVEIIQRRLRAFGLRRYRVERLGDRVLVEISVRDDQDPDRLTDLLGLRGSIGFHLVKPPDEARRAIDLLDQALARERGGADSLALGHRLPGDLLRERAEPGSHGGFGVLAEDLDDLRELLGTVDLDAVLPAEATLALSIDVEMLDGYRRGAVLYVLDRRPALTGAALKDADVRMGLDPRAPSAPGISLTMNEEGAADFLRVTGASIGRQLAIVLDGKVASAPVIRDRIPPGRAQITGGFTEQEARDLAIILRAGAVPAPVRIIEMRAIQPGEPESR